jgi:four helix bundle protein
MSKPFDLEERLIDFAADVIDVVESLPNTKAAAHIAGQLVRSGTAAAPNYAEARSDESRRDFVHKTKVALKELRETSVWLRLIRKKNYGVFENVGKLISECNELVAIFVSSIKTAKDNDANR